MIIGAKAAVRLLAIAGALLVLSSLATASAASAATPVWSENGTHLKFGSAVPFSAASAHGMTLKWTYQGLPMWVECNNLTASGTVENSGEGKAGTLKPTVGAAFTGCRLVQAGEQATWTGTTCRVPAEIPFEYKSGALTNTPYIGGGLKLSNVAIKFEITNCPHEYFHFITWEFFGEVTGTEGHGALPGEIRVPAGTHLETHGPENAEITFAMRFLDGEFTSTPIKVVEDEPLTPGHHYWYTGGGATEEGPPTLVPAGSPLSFEGAGNKLTLEGILAGFEVTISCSGGTSAGSVENPVGGGNGTASLTLTYVGCTVLRPEKEQKSCIIENGKISLAPMTGVLYKEGRYGPLKFSKFGRLALVSIHGCTTVALNHNWELTGNIYVSPYLDPRSPGAWSIPVSLTEDLILGGNEAIATGSLVAKTSSGQPVSLAE